MEGISKHNWAIVVIVSGQRGPISLQSSHPGIECVPHASVMAFCVLTVVGVLQSRFRFGDTIFLPWNRWTIDALSNDRCFAAQGYVCFTTQHSRHVRTKSSQNRERFAIFSFRSHFLENHSNNVHFCSYFTSVMDVAANHVRHGHWTIHTERLDVLLN